MVRDNTIGIVGRIKTAPELVVEAADWEREVYETTLTRIRHSGTEDTFVLQFDGRAAGSKEAFEKITEGTEVLVGGEIRSKNIRHPKPEENRTKVYIYAEIITVNDPPAEDQNEVTICGHICKPPRLRNTRKRTERGRRVAATNIVVAVNSKGGTGYIPCVCFGWLALKANVLKVGDCVEIFGRFQSRDYKKRIEGHKLPFLFTAYEVCAIRLKSEAEGEGTEPGKEEGSDT